MNEKITIYYSSFGKLLYTIKDRPCFIVIQTECINMGMYDNCNYDYYEDGNEAEIKDISQSL